MKPDLNRIQIAPGVGKRAAFEQRESGILHTPLQAETAFYDCIRQGDVQRLQEKMEDLRLIGRAKCLLIQYSHMTEQEAHRWIEQRSMDQRVTRRRVAEEILQKYEI